MIFRSDVNRSTFMSSKTEMDCAEIRIEVDVAVLLYVHRNRRFIRDGGPGRPPGLSHSS